MMTSPIVCTCDPDGAQRLAPYASVSCVRAKLRWPLSLGAMHCRDYVRCVLATLAVVYSRMPADLLDDLPVSSLASSDSAWPVRLCTSVHMVCEHLRIQCIHDGSLVQRGHVFTPSPLLGNPYGIQLARYYSSILRHLSKSGNGDT